MPRSARKSATSRMSPEERGGERRSALAVCLEVGARAGVQQQAGELDVVAVARLMQGSPATIVGAVRVGAAREQLPHHRLVAAAADGVGCQPEQVVAVRAARADESRVAVEQLPERLAVARLDRAERAPEGLAALGQVVHVATERRPARETVLPCEHEPRFARAERADLGVARVRERGVVGAHDRDPARQAALRRRYAGPRRGPRSSRCRRRTRASGQGRWPRRGRRRP